MCSLVCQYGLVRIYESVTFCVQDGPGGRRNRGVHGWDSWDSWDGWDGWDSWDQQINRPLEAQSG